MNGSFTPEIRAANAGDAAGCLAIYSPFVTESAASFETEPPSESEFAQRIELSNELHRWLVAIWRGEVVGYAYGNAHRSRFAYRYSAEVSIYLSNRARGQGLGSKLYSQLFEELATRGYFHAYAGITLPNDPSVALHRSLNFQSIGVFPKVGFKDGCWHDVSWWYRALCEGKPSKEPE